MGGEGHCMGVSELCREEVSSDGGRGALYGSDVGSVHRVMWAVFIE